MAKCKINWKTKEFPEIFSEAKVWLQNYKFLQKYKSTKNMLFRFRNKLSKIIFTFLILGFFCFSGAPKSQAAFWPAVDPGITSGLQKILDMVNGLIVGTLKQQAVRMLSMQVDMLAGNGSGGEASFIVHWETYLKDEPQNATNIYMNDYLSQMTLGRNTSSLYSAEGFSGGAGGSYASQLGQLNQVLANAKNPNSVPKLTYEGEPSQMLQSGNFKNMELYLSGVNNPWSFKIAVKSEQQKIYKEKQNEAMVKAMAYQGFRGTLSDANGSISNPGSLVKSALENAQDMPNRILQSASTIPEVATALVTQMINQTITQGFVSVRNKTAKSTANVTKYTNATNQAMNQYGPAVRFGANTAQDIQNKQAQKAQDDAVANQ